MKEKGRNKTIQTKSAEETRKLGEQLSHHLSGGEIIALIGELGSGKTVFVHGLAEGLGVQETVHSPSFTILNEYHGRLTLYHFDFYRLKSAEEVWELGWQDYLNNLGVVVIEWADRFPHVLPNERIEIRFVADATEENKRRITIQAIGINRDYTDFKKRLHRFCWDLICVICILICVIIFYLIKKAKKRERAKS
ncbi:MAG: tRNA (adenosine(37)-N6)-threonylcarbamoyltransferase complex ATPase subunit type 1 TsaE, partial [bacterium]|nr:tRNA (adenosine(37)-N6)-threonylcarbamoyltransferase complex ATPase subunit type 1 TsaE [bacterium]